jgi:hypothetical protein
MPCAWPALATQSLRAALRPGAAIRPFVPSRCSHRAEQGVIPLGGSKVELVERGPKGNKFGIKVTHPDFFAGRALVLAAESETGQKEWLDTLQDCSRV